MLKNRYYSGAKLSEYKFLRILDGYTRGTSINELEMATRTSAKTIRTIYGLLRERLAQSIIDEPEKFGRAGTHLAQPEARALLNAVQNCRTFRRHKKRHAPRLSCSQREELLVIEVAVLILCALDLREAKIEHDDLLNRLATGILTLKPREPLQKIAGAIPGARPHGHPQLCFFEDLRLALKRKPLEANSGSRRRMPIRQHEDRMGSRS